MVAVGVMTIEAAQHRQNGAYLRISQGVVNGLGGSSGTHQAVAAQSGEVLRQGRLAEANQANQLTNALLAFEQLAQDHQPVLIAESLEQTGRFASAAFQQHLVVHFASPAAAIRSSFC